MADTEARVGLARLLLALTFTTEIPLPGSPLRGESDPDEPPDVVTVAGLLAAVEALGRLSHVAVRVRRPLVDVVRAWGGDTEDPPAGRADRSVDPFFITRDQIERDVRWAVRRTWKPPADEPAQTPPPVFESEKLTMPGEGMRPMPAVVLSLRSPLEIVAGVPWEWFLPGAAGAGGFVFIKALEVWLNAPERIRVEHERLLAAAAVHRADRAEARKRELLALQRVDELRMPDGRSRLQSGTLRIDH